MKTIPSKVIFSKEEFTELNKEFKEIETELKKAQEAANSFKGFIERLSKVLNMDERALTNNELYITHDGVTGKYLLHSK